MLNPKTYFMESPFRNYIEPFSAEENYHEHEFTEAELGTPFTQLAIELFGEEYAEADEEEMGDDEIMNMEDEDLMDDSIGNVESFEDLTDEDDHENVIVKDNFYNEDEETLEAFESEEYEDDSEIVANEDFEEENLTSNLLVTIPSAAQQATVAFIGSQKRFDAWFNSVKSSKTFFTDEPQSNIDQLTIPPWIKAEEIYQKFQTAHGGDATSIIGDVTKKVKAKYFVIHDTANAGVYTAPRLKKKGTAVHLWLNAKAPAVLWRDWHEKGLGVKIENEVNNAFVHIELSRDPFLVLQVEKKTGGKKISYEQFMEAGGVRAFGTFYNDRQYHLLAYAYAVASLRKGKFLTVTVHREVDRSVMKKVKGEIRTGHGDPEFFDIDYFYSLVSAIFQTPLATYGIQNERVLAHKQGNMAGFVNKFIPFVTGDADAANQYGLLRKLIPSATKYKTAKVKLKNGYGYFYNANALNNNFQQTEVQFENYEGVLPSASVASTSGIIHAGISQLICEDVTMPGYTCYVHIKTGIHNKQLNTTGIYAPSLFNPSQPVDVLLYFHGMTPTFPGSCAKIAEYWSLAELPKYDLRIREEVNAGGKNILLVAPWLGALPNAEENKNNIGIDGGLDNYLQKVLDAVNEYVVKRRFKASPIQFNNIILSAHSAGGVLMRKIATASNPVYGSKVIECWGLDSLYEGPGLWLHWTKNNSGKKLFIYFKESTRPFAKKLDDLTKKPGNVFIKESSAKNHYLVPKEHLKERIEKLGRAGLTKTDFEEAQYEEENESYEWEDETLLDMEDYVTNLANAVRLNDSYAGKLGWRQHYNDINTLLLPYSGQVGISLNEEEFAYALAAWQKAQGMSDKDSDGILGPNTWRILQTQLTSTSTTTIPIAQTEWNASAVIRSRYASWQLYEAKRNDVVSWRITNPATYVEAAINEWNANRGIHNHFENGFDGPGRNGFSYVGAYLNVKRHYNALGIADPATYFTANIRSVTFFNRNTPAHTALITVLNTAQRNLVAAGQNFVFNDAWSFNPRTFRRDINQLSDHAMGKAIDINRRDNPLIINAGEILVINAVCGATLPRGFSAETNPVVFRNASDHFRATFNATWIAAQTDRTLLRVIANPDRLTALNGYAARGFMNLPPALVTALQSAGASWGGSWRSPKDFMHFQVP